MLLHLPYSKQLKQNKHPTCIIIIPHLVRMNKKSCSLILQTPIFIDFFLNETILYRLWYVWHFIQFYALGITCRHGTLLSSRQLMSFFFFWASGVTACNLNCILSSLGNWNSFYLFFCLKRKAIGNHHLNISLRLNLEKKQI